MKTWTIALPNQRNMVSVLLVGAIAIVGCSKAQVDHIALGSWTATGHSVRIYADHTAAVDGIAATWEPVGSSTVKLALQYNERDVIWEFTVTGEPRSTWRSGEARERSPEDVNTNPPEEYVRGTPPPDIMDMVERGQGVNIVTFLIDEARLGHGELGTLYTGTNEGYFIREPKRADP